MIVVIQVGSTKSMSVDRTISSPVTKLDIPLPMLLRLVLLVPLASMSQNLLQVLFLMSLQIRSTFERVSTFIALKSAGDLQRLSK